MTAAQAPSEAPSVAPDTARSPAPGAEIRALLSSLDGQRRHVLGILEGLDAEALRMPVLPSGWSCLGLVQHLALDVERFWFRAVFTGDPAVIAALAEIDDAWQVAPDADADEVLDLYRAQTRLADAVITAATADAPLAWWPHEQFGDPHLHTLRDVLLHIITETACHAGHLDAARELLDGRRWLVLT
ncbi:DinB family protein [Streptomyces sp. NBC_01022]|uniref:DinB family protein n=1 Tax=Streptomyces sp. NBC_01022 TaxID=2903723 RepID=UPI002DD8EE9D|nr:DinB family protein [Streptomyces sp. NBC_01022]WRZ84426.1 DinB family protein [Streptomyces sp. NBC_01022]